MSIKIGILGTANIAITSVIPALLSLGEHFKVCGIASRNIKKAEVPAKRFGVPAFDSYQKLLDQKELDAIYIPLPNAMHAEWIKRALSRNVHVLVEKPLACTLPEVDHLIQIAREKNLVLVENFQFRKHRQLAFLKDVIAKNKIGELRSLRAFFGFPPFTDKKNIRYEANLGGGALLDAGVYTLKASQILLDGDIKVAAASLSIDPNKGVDIWGNGLLKSSTSALTASISFGFDNFYQCGVELWGSMGKLYTNRLFTAKRGFSPIITIESAAGTENIKVEPDDQFKNMLLHFSDLIINQNKADIEIEYKQNLNQARLLQSFRDMANGK